MTLSASRRESDANRFVDSIDVRIMSFAVAVSEDDVCSSASSEGMLVVLFCSDSNFSAN